ncbi:DUF3016 domain-containing protein [Paraneptunicella aestuarii]|uniref:DUF3016 domain-containing protein n=1 Tax=Paraneptunicella aestuarii TaxID=2831148 RepID=UPI001E635072|nr:DUF3016 domain-containing protein [Paraneptunicella aestuarii]UAA38315.1 DUF3016 domain-containing protein [Paraneptunicella aestuarii]
MKTLLVKASIVALFCSSFAFAEDTENNDNKPDRVQIEWQNPKDYSDVRPANQSAVHFREHTFEEIDKLLEKLMKKQPEGQTLKMTVTDLDLAGRVWPGHFVGMDTPSDVRMVKRIDFPSMDFSYQLLDANGKVIQEGTEEIKDMSFQDRSSRRFQNDTLHYEKVMIQDWFNKAFLKDKSEDE